MPRQDLEKRHADVGIREAAMRSIEEEHVARPERSDDPQVDGLERESNDLVRERVDVGARLRIVALDLAGNREAIRGPRCLGFGTGAILAWPSSPDLNNFVA